MDETYVEIWMTPPPDVGVQYRVLRDEWNADFTERRIFEIKVMVAA